MYDYANWPDKFISEKYYNKNYSLQLESRNVTKTNYLADGRISRIVYLERLLSYEDFEYYGNKQLKSQILVREGAQILKYVYRYDKNNKITRRETYSQDRNDPDKLKLYYYETYSYKYY